jgi:hypothetical protein
MIRITGLVLSGFLLAGCATQNSVQPVGQQAGQLSGAVRPDKTCDAKRNPNIKKCSIAVTATLSGDTCTLTIDTNYMVLESPSTDRLVGFLLKSNFSGTFDSKAPIKFFEGSETGPKGRSVQNPPLKLVEMHPSKNSFVLESTSEDKQIYAYSIHVVGTHGGKQIQCDSDPIIRNGS